MRDKEQESRTQGTKENEKTKKGGGKEKNERPEKREKR